MRTVPSCAGRVTGHSRLAASRNARARIRMRRECPLVEAAIDPYPNLSRQVLNSGTLCTAGEGSGAALEIGDLECLRADWDAKAHMTADVHVGDRLRKAVGGMADRDRE